MRGEGSDKEAPRLFPAGRWSTNWRHSPDGFGFVALVILHQLDDQSFPMDILPKEQ